MTFLSSAKAQPPLAEALGGDQSERFAAFCGVDLALDRWGKGATVGGVVSVAAGRFGRRLVLQESVIQ
ncbi:hypothetical protein N7U49_02595 [Streptomyces sp. AD2-2]|nr:hypothetical protein N7U49_02595 [Streptomyces sp. AD2-2]